MSEIKQLVCDECGKTKGDANHWHKLWVNRNTYEFSNFSFVDSCTNYIGDIRLDNLIREDFCSEGCVNKAVHKLMFEQPSRIIEFIEADRPK